MTLEWGTLYARASQSVALKTCDCIMRMLSNDFCSFCRMMNLRMTCRATCLRCERRTSQLQVACFILQESRWS